MFFYHRDELTAPANQRALSQAAAAADDRDNALFAICRHLGRVIIGCMTVMIVIQLAVHYWGGQP